MPMSVNVGLSRKASRNFQSTGVSINVTAELDSALLAKPQALQEEIANLYGQAAEALDRESSRMVLTLQSQEPPAICNGRGNGHRANAAHRQDGANGKVLGQLEAPMTVNQLRAIGAIAARLKVDPEAEARALIGFELNRLTVREASTLIDHLKSFRATTGQSGEA